VRVLLDTCALLWLALDEKRLTPPALTALESPDSEVYVSAVSVWEIAIKAQSGKLPGLANLPIHIIWVIRQSGFHELSISMEHGHRAGMLPGAHKDPFDRLLIAQAQAENLPIVSSDRIFDRYGVRRIW
jgi:PIN domain nuclease of toxin-antitoxin system